MMTVKKTVQQEKECIYKRAETGLPQADTVSDKSSEKVAVGGDWKVFQNSRRR